MKVIKIATRNSKLAMWQAEWVQKQLAAAELQSQLVPMETIGDRKLNTTIAKIGSKGVFTEELETQLASGEVDIAVHSAKDLSSHLPEGFELIAYGPRAAGDDVLVAHKPVDLSASLVIGTASTRRVAQLAKHYPQFSTTTVRGNLQTRMKKMKEGACDALLLASAGVDRMGFNGYIQHRFSMDELTPAAGQGSIGIECHENIHKTLRKLIRAATNDKEAERRILAERAFLRKMEGGCSVPVFAHATLQKDHIHMTGGVLSLDGQHEVRKKESRTDPEQVGLQLARQVIEAGGARILEDVKKQMQ